MALRTTYFIVPNLRGTDKIFVTEGDAKDQWRARYHVLKLQPLVGVLVEN